MIPQGYSTHSTEGSDRSSVQRRNILAKALREQQLEDEAQTGFQTGYYKSVGGSKMLSS